MRIGVWLPVRNGVTETVFTLLDREDAASFAHRALHLRDGYVVTSRMEGVHRLILAAPRGRIVDHINRDRLDNRRENLRFCTIGQNLRNSRKRTGANPYKGVTKAQYGKWRAQIFLNYHYHFIGNFTTPEEAARAYDEVARAIHQEFAGLNFT